MTKKKLFNPAESVLSERCKQLKSNRMLSDLSYLVPWRKLWRAKRLRLAEEWTPALQREHDRRNALFQRYTLS